MPDFFFLTVGHAPKQNSQPIKLKAVYDEASGTYALATSGGGAGGSQDVNVISDSVNGPASNAEAVTPGAGALSNTTRALFVGTGGDVTVTMAGGGSVQFTNVPDGTTLPIRVTHVTAATASDIVALW